MQAGFGYEAGGWQVDRHPRMLADLDGDGRDDIVGFGNAGVYVVMNQGDGSFGQTRFAVASYGYDGGAGGWRVSRHPRMMGEVTGDDQAEIVGHHLHVVDLAVGVDVEAVVAAGLVVEDHLELGGRLDLALLDDPGHGLEVEAGGLDDYLGAGLGRELALGLGRELDVVLDHDVRGAVGLCARLELGLGLGGGITCRHPHPPTWWPRAAPSIPSRDASFEELFLRRVWTAPLPLVPSPGDRIRADPHDRAAAGATSLTRISPPGVHHARPPIEEALRPSRPSRPR